MSETKHPGSAVSPIACSPPSHEIIEGHYVTLIPTEAGHAEELWQVVGGSATAGLYDYMPYGPFHNAQDLIDRVAALASSADPLFWTIKHRDSAKLLGWLSLLRIDTANRVVEIGHILYAPQLQRTTAATEAWFLLANKAVSENSHNILHRTNQPPLQVLGRLPQA